MKAAVVGTAIITSIDVLLKANLSHVRVMSMKKAASVVGIAAAKAEIASRLKWWHVLNPNHAEYTPIFASFMLYLGLRQSLLSKPLTRGQSLACWCTTLSPIMFVVGYLDSITCHAMRLIQCDQPWVASNRWKASIASPTP